MAINFRSNTVISNLRIGPLSGGGNGGGGGSSEPSYLAVGASNEGNGRSVYVYDAASYSTVPTKILQPSGLDGSEQFGSPVAVTSDYLIVGARREDSVLHQAGAIYVYNISNLSATPTRLAPSDLQLEDHFGASIAATSNQIVVGAYNDDDQGSNAGAVYVYNANNLSATPTKLAPSVLVAGASFGWSVAATSNHIVVGAYTDTAQVNYAGAVYVYDANNLSATPTKLAPSDLGYLDLFGSSVAATSNHIVIGAERDDDQGNDAGAVYVYDANNLSATPTKLAPSGLDANGYFGASVAASSDYIVVGAYQNDDQGSSAGAVYVYDANNLSATPTKLAPSGLDAGDYFGRSISVYGSQLIVGAERDGDQGYNAGAVYVYDVNNLSNAPTKLTASDGGVWLSFGGSVSLG